MKTIKKNSLTNLEERELEKREMNNLSGGTPGECCICANGTYNYYANLDDGLYSPSLMGSYSRLRG